MTRLWFSDPLGSWDCINDHVVIEEGKRLTPSVWRSRSKTLQSNAVRLAGWTVWNTPHVRTRDPKEVRQDIELKTIVRISAGSSWNY